MTKSVQPLVSIVAIAMLFANVSFFVSACPGQSRSRHPLSIPCQWSPTSFEGQPTGHACYCGGAWAWSPDKHCEGHK